MDIYEKNIAKLRAGNVTHQEKIVIIKECIAALKAEKDELNAYYTIFKMIYPTSKRVDAGQIRILKCESRISKLEAIIAQEQNCSTESD